MKRVMILSILLLIFPLVVIAGAVAVLFISGLYTDIWAPLVAVGTLELALVAALQDRIRDWSMSPRLDIEARSEAPDFHGTYAHAIKFLLANSQSERIPVDHRVYYSRLRVHNKGEAAAEKVEVTVKNVYKKVANRFERDNSFPLDNLNWSTIGSTVVVPAVSQDSFMIHRKFIPAVYCDYIAPSTYKYCTLGHIYDPKYRNNDEYGTPRFIVPDNETVFCLDVSFISNLRYYFLSKGTYRIEVQVSCANAKPISKTYEFSISGKWSDEDEMMLKEGFTIHEVSSGD